jgi:hypothetical protein
MSTKIEIKLDVEVPKVPNFLITPAGTVPIYAVTEDALRQLGAAWTEALVERAKVMKRQSKAER